VGGATCRGGGRGDVLVCGYKKIKRGKKRKCSVTKPFLKGTAVFKQKSRVKHSSWRAIVERETKADKRIDGDGEKRLAASGAQGQEGGGGNEYPS
jgi:hypothetical protein